MNSFKNKQILITGGAGGIGLIMDKCILKKQPPGLLSGILITTKVFDFLAGRLFQVYHTMDTFQGHQSENK